MLGLKGRRDKLGDRVMGLSGGGEGRGRSGVGSGGSDLQSTVR